MKLKALFLSAVFLIVAGFSYLPVVSSDELDDITKQLNDLTNSLSQSKAATAPLEAQLNSIRGRVSSIEQEIPAKQKSIDDGYKRLEKQQGILNKTIRAFYVKTYYSSPFIIFLSAGDASEITQILAYQKATADHDKLTITNIAIFIQGLEKKKKTLEEEKRKLAVVKADLDKIVGEAKSFQNTLSGKIAELSAKQQSILNQRLASLNIPRSAGTSARGCSDDRGVNPGFSPRLAFFTYGAPHRNGLNQYGAFSRAKEGQGEDYILQAYYPNMSLKKDYDQNAQINVDGFGNYSIEEYVKRIYEVPESWGDQGGMAALKAQAVAARTYALNSQQRNGHICTTEACQVFRQDPKTGKWAEAVSATAGWVLMDGGNPGFTQNASTHGGYILNLGKFDGRNGNPGNFGELNDRAYDKESPWFYCDWGSRSEYNKTAWLKPQEVADIVNVILLARADSSTGDHLYQTDKPHPYGGEVWNEERVKQELRNKGTTPFGSINDISVGADFGSGSTSNINLSGDAGSISFSGSEFKNWFNLRAPANIQIVGPLYNVEKR